MAYVCIHSHIRNDNFLITHPENVILRPRVVQTFTELQVHLSLWLDNGLVHCKGVKNIFLEMTLKSSCKTNPRKKKTYYGPVTYSKHCLRKMSRCQQGSAVKRQVHVRRSRKMIISLGFKGNCTWLMCKGKVC